MLCLDIKGLTGTIGAIQMQTFILEIIQQIVYHEEEDLTKYIAPFSATLATLKESIDSYLAA